MIWELAIFFLIETDESSMAAEVIFPTATMSPTTNQQGQSVDAFLERL